MQSKQKTVQIKETILSILSTNAMDMKDKEEDLKNKVRFCKIGIYAVQETHYKRKGKFKMQDYCIFEAIRKNK